MKERPILFSGEMVRAILDLIKKMTRRTRGLEIVNRDPDFYEFAHVIHSPESDGRFGAGRYTWAGFYFKGQRDPKKWTGAPGPSYFKCPYGTVGDRLWVRETFSGDDWHGYVYRATEPDALPCGDEIIFKKWKPSIYMPRAASRILLEITDIRVERLNDISDEDAKAEGCDNSNSESAIAIGWYEKPERAFIRLWESINGSGSWKKNPWVWVICFKRVER